MNSRQEADVPAWWPRWSDHVAVVVATGASAADAPLSEIARQAKVITIKESWQLAPWAGVLYGSDGAWWANRKGVPGFSGLKITASPNAARMFGLKLVRLLALDRVLLNKPGTIGCGSRFGNGHSGFHALNLAAQFGARKIVLVGFDLCGSRWHDQGPAPADEKLMAEWREGLDGCAEQLVSLGIEVINTSDVSALKNFRKASLLDAVAG